MRSRTIYNDTGDVIAKFVDGVLVSGEVPDRPLEAAHNPQIQIFKSGLFEHVAEHPIYAGSKAELRHICADYNCHSDYAG